MSRASRARRVALAAAYGGGTLGAVVAILLGLLLGQARWARWRVGQPKDTPPVADGCYGADRAGPPLVLAFLGDSSAAGFGVDRAVDTPGAVIATGLSEAADRPVQLVNAARVGARSAHLLDQVAVVLPHSPDVAVIMVGANDVTHRVRPATSVRELSAAVRTLHDANVQVVVGTCPDLGTVEPIGRPLRWVARRWSRYLAAVQTVGVVEAGGRSVSLGNLLGPEFAAAPREMFSADRFHPSASGYARAASALLPSVIAALGVAPEFAADERPVAARGEAVSSLAEAAVQAVEEPGTEVAAAELAGRERGPWGRWVVLRHRIRWPMRRPTAAQPEEPVR